MKGTNEKEDRAQTPEDDTKIRRNFELRLHDISKINFDIVLSCLNIQANNRYNIYIQFSIQYQDCDVKNVKNLVLS